MVAATAGAVARQAAHRVRRLRAHAGQPLLAETGGEKKSPKLAMRPPDHHPPGWAPPSSDPWPASPPPMLSRAPDSAAPPPPMPSHTPVKDDNGGDPWPAGSADPWPPPMPPQPDARPPPMPAHTPKSLQKSQNNGRRTGSRRRRRKQRHRSGPARPCASEIDSDDSDDDEREWSLRHALDEFGVTKVRVKGKQGVALFASEKDAATLCTRIGWAPGASRRPRVRTSIIEVDSDDSDDDEREWSLRHWSVDGNKY